ncbi:MAG: transposase family protein [Myxococcota bacterium]
MRLLVVVDEYSREALMVRARRSFRGTDVIDALTELFRLHGAPKHHRSDNGPEFITKAVRDFPKRMKVGMVG